MNIIVIQHWAELIAQILGGLCVFATALARILPKKADDEITKASEFIFKVIAWMPTIGVNPQTAALKAAYDDAKSKLEDKSAVTP